MGIYIKNGFVKQGDRVEIEVTLPKDSKEEHLPKALTIFPQYLETADFRHESLPLRWSKGTDGWKASIEYTPTTTGNFSARVRFGDTTYSAYFAVWKPGISVQVVSPFGCILFLRRRR